MRCQAIVSSWGAELIQFALQIVGVLVLCSSCSYLLRASYVSRRFEQFHLILIGTPSRQCYHPHFTFGKQISQLG